MSSDIKYMQRAYDLAAKGRGKTSPNPMVGAVIVKKGKIIAEGWHKKCGALHAEALALKKAGTKAKGATLYVTLEPCHHFGRTPPCVDQVIAGGIKEVVIGHSDPNPLTAGKSIRKLKRAGIKVRVGVLKKELRQLNEAFITSMTKGRPFITAKIAQTLDGKVATAKGRSKWITGPQTREYTHRMRDHYDGIMVGVNTILKDNPYLSGKKKAIRKIVLDSELKTPLNANIFKGTRRNQCLIAATRKAPVAKIKALAKKGAEVLICREKQGRVDLVQLFRELAKKELRHILIEGGPRVLGSALKNKCVDKLQVYIAPKIAGDQNALSAVQGVSATDINKAIRLDSVEMKSIGNDICLEGYINKTQCHRDTKTQKSL